MQAVHCNIPHFDVNVKSGDRPNTLSPLVIYSTNWMYVKCLQDLQNRSLSMYLRVSIRRLNHSCKISTQNLCMQAITSQHDFMSVTVTQLLMRSPQQHLLFF